MAAKVRYLGGIVNGKAGGCKEALEPDLVQNGSFWKLKCRDGAASDGRQRTSIGQSEDLVFDENGKLDLTINGLTN